MNVNIHFLEARSAFAARVLLLLLVENVIKNCFPALWEQLATQNSLALFVTRSAGGPSEESSANTAPPLKSKSRDCFRNYRNSMLNCPELFRRALPPPPPAFPPPHRGTWSVETVADEGTISRNVSVSVYGHFEFAHVINEPRTGN